MNATSGACTDARRLAMDGTLPAVEQRAFGLHAKAGLGLHFASRGTTRSQLASSWSSRNRKLRRRSQPAVRQVHRSRDRSEASLTPATTGMKRGRPTLRVRLVNIARCGAGEGRRRRRSGSALMGSRRVGSRAKPRRFSSRLDFSCTAGRSGSVLAIAFGRSCASEPQAAGPGTDGSSVGRSESGRRHGPAPIGGRQGTSNQ